jgi:glycosyltransferase involved in cell wall biosynthesis
MSAVAPVRAEAAALATADVTIIILTFNEERHIERALASVRPFARDIVVVDSFSTDRTVEIACAGGARVLANTFVNQARQFAWALDHADVRTGWVLRLDADEIIEPDLQQEIAVRLSTLTADVAGVTFSRKHIFMDRWVRHGGRWPLVMLRLWRTGQGRVEDRWMDEHVVVWGGGTVAFAGGFADANLHDLTFFTDKHNRYATREAIEILLARHRLGKRDEALSPRTASRQASIKRQLKERFYNRLPFWLGPLGYFLYRYIVQLGFLDGRSGLIYHVLQGFWYRFLVNAKVFEYQRAMRSCRDDDERLATLSRVTGHDLTPADAPAATVARTPA